MLAAHGEFGEFGATLGVTFEETAGLVPITIERRHAGRFWCELAAPEALSLGPTVPTSVVAAAASIAEDDVLTATHQPQAASVGLAFLLAELRDRRALERARPNVSGLDRMGSSEFGQPYLHLTTTGPARGSTGGGSPRASRWAAPACWRPGPTSATAGWSMSGSLVSPSG